MDRFSPVERQALARAPGGPMAPADERAPVIVVESFPLLGKLTALRFLEWVQDHPEGLVSLPTGKTPEHFIKWVTRLLSTWDEDGTRAMLEGGGVNPAKKPALGGLRFVQIDDFYPINSSQENSFFHYVNKYYLSGFGLDPARALLMDTSRLALTGAETLENVWPDMEVDLTLRHRAAKTHLEEKQQAVLSRIDQWCQEYENHVRDAGGLGFFLGGIGPDGHIGFNVRGSDHHSTTRLTPTNYETQAAAATDLGGIEVARKRLVITIGLGTIAFNPECVAIIMAAGEAKAGVIADAILNPPDVKAPASVLHKLKNARFYLTQGAAKLLPGRQAALLLAEDRLTAEQEDKLVIDLSLALKKRLVDLTEDDFNNDAAVRPLLKHKSPADAVRHAADVRDRLTKKIEAGCISRKNTKFLHTEPHHDDVMLGYLAAIIRNTRDPANTHHFATLTSGFTSVTSDFLRQQLDQARRFLQTDACARLMAEGYFVNDAEHRDRDVWQYLDGVAANNEAMKEEGEARRMLRDLATLAGSTARDALEHELRRAADPLAIGYPGQKDPAHIQKLKGMRREWEVECLWGFLGWSTANVRHLRLGFYTGDLFTQEPTLSRDVPPVLDLLKETAPDIVTVAFDPEGSGPDTHYKVLQATAAAVGQYIAEGAKPPTIWGYRNVWFRFHPAEADLWVPVSLNMIATMEKAFLNTFISQKTASFPSPELDGPFCDLAQAIQVDQYQMAKTLLGREWFQEHPSAFIRATRGLVFLRQMDAAEFENSCRALRQATENRG